jgi:DNA-directed RNA polymerase specialized sigma24 family protein
MSKKEKKLVTVNYYGDELEVTEEVRNVIVRDFWRLNKERDRHTRCIVENGKRCDRPCSECPYTRSGGDFSVEQMEECGVELSSGENTVEDIVIENDIHEKLAGELDAMPYIDSAILKLKYEGLSDAEIAKALGLKQTTVSHRKRKLISELLLRYSDEI